MAGIQRPKKVVTRNIKTDTDTEQLKASKVFAKALACLPQIKSKVDLFRHLTKMLDSPTNESSKLKSIVYYPNYNSILETELSSELSDLLDEMLENESNFPVVFVAGATTMIVSREHRVIGGGHNDAPTYRNVIVFRLASVVINADKGS